MKLHLGCRDKKIHGFVNVDIRADVNPDLVDDVFKLEKVEKDSIDLIYSSHCHEHATRKQGLEAFRRYYEILKPGGTLRLSVPDLEAIFAAYFYYRNLRLLQNLLYGAQQHDYDYHYNGWDFKTMKEDLDSVGFINVRLWDWKTTPPHNYVDDYSQAYLPSHHKKYDRDAKLMSLNVEADKPSLLGL